MRLTETLYSLRLSRSCNKLTLGSALYPAFLAILAVLCVLECPVGVLYIFCGLPAEPVYGSWASADVSTVSLYPGADIAGALSFPSQSWIEGPSRPIACALVKNAVVQTMVLEWCHCREMSNVRACPMGLDDLPIPTHHPGWVPAVRPCAGGRAARRMSKQTRG